MWDELFLLHSGEANLPVRRAGSSGLFIQRSHSQLGGALSRQNSEDQGSECSECGMGSSSGRIALAKKVLAEATRVFTPCVSLNAAKSDKCRNTGALGPLMCMIQSEQDSDSLKCCLDTLSFMLLDKANRNWVVHELSGLNILLELFETQKDMNVLKLALDCVCTMAKTDDREKERVWQHPGKKGILAMVSPRASLSFLLEVMCMLRKISFRGTGTASELLEPQLLQVVADLLSTQQPLQVQLKCCKFLKCCAEAASNEQLTAWQRLLPMIITLIKHPATIDSALGVLGALSEWFAFKNLFTAANGMPILLPLLCHQARSVRLAASCILSCLSEGGLSRDLLGQKPSIALLLAALSSNTLCSEVAVAVVYTLNNLSRQLPAARSYLIDLNAEANLQQLLITWRDGELQMGARQLLQALAFQREKQSQTVQAKLHQQARLSCESPKMTTSSSCASVYCSVLHEHSRHPTDPGIRPVVTSISSNALQACSHEDLSTSRASSLATVSNNSTHRRLLSTVSCESASMYASDDTSSPVAAHASVLRNPNASPTKSAGPILLRSSSPLPQSVPQWPASAHATTSLWAPCSAVAPKSMQVQQSHRLMKSFASSPCLLRLYDSSKSIAIEGC